MKKIAVLGGGPAGYVVAIRAAQMGAKVTLIEKDELGGVCLNSGCIPTKSLLKTSETADSIKKSKELGIDASLNNMNWDVAISRKNRIIKNLKLGLQGLISSNKIELIKGSGEVISRNKIIVETYDGTVEINYEKIILATGTSPSVPKIKGIELPNVISSTEALNLEKLPESIVIIGAGVIGLEFAFMLSDLGVKVSVLEYQDKLLSEEDTEISETLIKIIKRKGINLKLSAEISEITKQDALIVNYNETNISGEYVLIATGRKSNLESFKNLNLDIKNEFVVVNDRMETNIENIYACGDITGGKLLAHKAYAEGKIAAENALGINIKINENAIPSCIYTSPEIASVGFTEQEALNQGIKIKTGKFYFRNNGRALSLGSREGFVKIIADEQNRIIGGQIFGENASEMISEITLAVSLKATAEDLANLIHPHPSLSEAIWEACSEIIGRSIHKM